MLEVLYQPFPMLEGRRAQVWQHHPAFWKPRHFHPEPELNIVLRGRATIAVGDRVLDCGPGGVLFFQPGQDHALLEASPDLDLRVLALRPDLAEQAQLSLSHLAGAGTRLAAVELSKIVDALDSLGQMADPARIETLASDVFTRLCRQVATNHVVSRRALQLVRSDPSASCQELASTMKIDPSVLSRRFRTDMDVTFVEFRARRRLMDFVRLADQGENLTQAAISAGFGSYAQCHRVFVRTLGCAPQRYFGGLRQLIDSATASENRGHPSWRNDDQKMQSQLGR